MRIPPLITFYLGLAAACAGADNSLVHARRAQALLGAEVWSQIIRVENTARASAYPRTLHALVFELAGILWFYSDVDGTQSFSLHVGRLAEEKADFGPLLRDIDRGFARWTKVEADMDVTAAVAPEAELPNGCFIESYAALRMLVAQGKPVGEPRLLSYYAKSPVRRQGHTVLAYSIPGRVVVVDPERPGQPLTFPVALGRDAMRLARAVQGPEVARARTLSLEVPAGRSGRDVFAASDPRAPDRVVR